MDDRMEDSQEGDMPGFTGTRQSIARQLSDAVAARDLDLMRQAAQGDRTAYGRIVLMHQDRLFTAMLRISGNREDARDITQEAFFRGLENVKAFAGRSAVYTWLFRIALNLALTKLRTEKRRNPSEAGSSPKGPYPPGVYGGGGGGLGGGGGAGGVGVGGGGGGGRDQASGLIDRLGSKELAPDAALLLQEQAQRIRYALSLLDVDHRTVLVLRDVEGFDYLQISEVLDLPLGTVKSRINRARSQLREELKRLDVI